MTNRITPSTILLLIIPPILWAGNAIVGRVVVDLIPPATINFIRWLIAMFVLLPFGYAAFKKNSGLLKNWRMYSILGLFGIGLYNGIQYLALHTSSPVNITLVASSMPVWMIFIGRMFFNSTINKQQLIGAILSIVGVLLVLSHGSWNQFLQFSFVIGDLYMVLATIIWAIYSWLLTKTNDNSSIRSNWAAFLLAQIFYGVFWSAAFAGIEYAYTDWYINWNLTLLLCLIYVIIGPAIIAYRCWGAAVSKVGPNLAAIFFNLTPLFAAILSTVLLGEFPQLYHLFAFILIIGGIITATRK